VLFFVPDAERQLADGTWAVVATDRDPELLYVWKPAVPSPVPLDPPFIGSSTAEAVWTIPRGTPAGTYRLRHEGVAQTAPGAGQVAYSGASSPFAVAEAPGECP